MKGTADKLPGQVQANRGLYDVVMLITAGRRTTGRLPARPIPRRWRWMLVLVTALLALPAQSRAEPVRLAGRSFGERTVIEVRDLATADADRLIRQAFTLLAELESLTDRRDGAVAELNRQAGNGPQPAPDALREILTKALEFCVWSDGAHGPLGGRIYDLWGRGKPQETGPTPSATSSALDSAACDRIRIDDEAGTVNLASGSEIDLTHFVRGAAVDRVVDQLRNGGAGNLWVEIDPVQRGAGPGPGGKGWFSEIAEMADEGPSLADLHLNDKALAIAALDRHPLQIGGLQLAPYIDQRRPKKAPVTAHPGRPREGIRAVVTVTDLAVDAEGLATALFILGSTEGQFRLGGLRPTPAALWLLGGQRGTAIVTSFHWSQVRQ